MSIRALLVDLDPIRRSPYRPAASGSAAHRGLTEERTRSHAKTVKTSCITDGNHRGSFGASEGGTLLNSASASLFTSGFFRRGDRLTVMLGLPVAVARGNTSITLPVQTLSGSIEQRPIEIDLAPNDREMRLGIEYRYAFGKHSELVFSAAYADNYGHVAGRRSEAAFAGFSARF